MTGQWERGGPLLIRIAVPGGWIYQHTEAGTLCFVPQPAPPPAPAPSAAQSGWPGPEDFWP